MARELRRLLIAPSRLAPPSAADPSAADPDTLPLVPLEAEESHYLRRVLRLRSGDRLQVLDGCGHLWGAAVEGEAGLRLEQPLRRPLQSEPRARPRLQLAMAPPRRDADVVWRMATELGADRLRPLLAERSVGRELSVPPRWGAIVREATEQCERLWLPEVEAMEPAAEWFARVEGWRLLATTRQGGLLPLEALLREARSGKCGPELTLAIGPEGGWTPAEEAAAAASGWQAVSLGPAILRTSTAAVAGVAALAAWRRLAGSPAGGEALSCAPSSGPSP